MGGWERISKTECSELWEAREMKGKKKVNRKGLVFGIVLALVAVVFVGVPMNVSAAGEYSLYFAGGTGTESDPYQIANVVQLQNIKLD